MIQKGDHIEIIFEDSCLVDEKITGVVIQIFDALTDTGEADINLEIDVRYGNGKWFRYKPLKDGGTYKTWRKNG